MALTLLLLAATTHAFSPAKSRVVVVGSSNQDLIASGARIPRPGETVLHETFATSFGGKGANQAVQAALLGATTSMVARVGDDAFGREMLDNFESCNVDTAHVELRCPVSSARAEVGVAPGPSGVALIAVGAEDQTNSIVVVPGANAKLTKEDVAASEEIFRDAAVVLCQMEVPAEANLEALNAARAAGCVSVLNTAPVPPGGVDDSLIKAAAIVCPNEVELALLVGADADSTATIPGALDAARKLRARGADTVLATLGANGALVVSEASAFYVPAVAGVKAVDTTGAGDSFLGGFAAALAAGATTAAAVRAAAAVAAHSVQAPGAQPSYGAAADFSFDFEVADPPACGDLLVLKADGSFADFAGYALFNSF